MGNTIIFEKENVLDGVKDLIASMNPWDRLKAVIHYDGGGRTNTRLAVSTAGRVVQMAKNSRRRGFPMVEGAGFNRILSVVVTIPDAPKSLGEQKAEEYRKHVEYMRKNVVSPAWPNLLERLDQITPEFLQALENHVTPEPNLFGLGIYDAVKGAGVFWLDSHKTTTLKSNECPQFIQDKVAEQWGQDFAHYWTGKRYHYSVQGKHCDDGIYRVWFANEYHGKGNGYYWLMISPTQATLCEKD